MKNIIGKTCFLFIAFCYGSKHHAEEYVTLNAKIDYTGIVILDKNASDYNSNIYQQEAIAESIQIVSSSGNKIKDEAILELKNGEAAKLLMMFSVHYGPGSNPQIPEIGQTHGWSVIDMYPDANGAHLFEVKYPGHENWFRLYYDSGHKIWTGLGVNDPTIVGPCTLKLTKYAGIKIYGTSNNNNKNQTQHYLTQYSGGNAWVTLNMIKSASSGATTKAQSLVLPEGSGDLSVIMEGSNDLINWTREDLGKKPEANRKTFYRIRAVKE